MQIFGKSDYLYLLITNAILKKATTQEKFQYLRKNIYSKGSQYNIAKAIISGAFSNDEYEMFYNIIERFYQHNLLTHRKRQELLHIIELKYDKVQRTDTDIQIQQMQ